MRLTLYSDGGARGNPGPAATGFVIYDEAGEILCEKGEYIGIGTNNQAEYKGLLSALEKAKKVGGTEVVCFLDSELIVRQINGQYKVKNEGLKELFQKVIQLLANFRKTEFKHVPREQNKRADLLLNQALDERQT